MDNVSEQITEKVDNGAAKSLHFYYPALCIRKAWNIKHENVSLADKNSNIKSLVMQRVSEALRSAPELQAEFSFRESNESDFFITSSGVIVKPDIIFLEGNQEFPGILRMVPSFVFRKLPNSVPFEILNMVAIMSYVYGIESFCLFYDRDGMNFKKLRYSELANEDARNAASEFASRMDKLLSSDEEPEIPFRITRIFSQSIDNFISVLPEWPCKYCELYVSCITSIGGDQSQ